MKFKIELFLILVLLFFNVIFLINLKPTGFVVKENSPHNFLSEDKIIFYDDHIVINISDYVVSRYESTNSMVPVLDSNSNGIGIIPFSPEEIHVGDIVSFYRDSNLIVHRVIEKSIDSKGIYFVTKGDNNNFDDGKVRFEEIDSVLIALIY